MDALAVAWTPAALQELREAQRYYADRSRRAALEFRGTVRAGLDVIARIPEAFAPMPERRGVFVTAKRRRYRLDRPFAAFALIYEVRGQTVLILALEHGKRRPGYWQDR